MSPRCDPIALVEACYDLAASEEGWLHGLAAASLGLLQSRPHGVIAYHVELLSDGFRLVHSVQAGGELDVVSRIRRMAGLLERKRSGEATWFESMLARIYERVGNGVVRAPVDRMLMSELDKVGPDWMYTLGVPGVRDHFMLRSHHIDGLGVTFVVAGLSETGALRPAERQMHLMLSAHVKAGLRLRRRLSEHSGGVAAPAGGAVLDAAARVVHAEDEARTQNARDALREMARRIDRARTARAGRDAAALAAWHGLVQGRWSLVDRFDADGKRFMLAHRNPEHVVDPRGLSNNESRVTALAARGYSNKLIGYHLGLSEGTVSTHLHNALHKLGIGSRVELARVLGTRAPPCSSEMEQSKR